MFKKKYAIIVVILFLAISGISQETEDAATSAITESRLPAGAVRISPDSVPAEISDGLNKIVQAGGANLTEGNREVLAWSGPGYRKANATVLIGQLQASLKIKGWVYKEAGTEGGITVFGVSRTSPTRRGILGFYIPTDDALVLAWTEVMQDAGAPQTDQEAVPAKNSGEVGNIVGSWDNGRVSTVSRQNTITGAASPGSSTRFEYTFRANGTYGFTGLAQTQNYSCMDTLYNEVAGKYTIIGDQITLSQTKNFWRKTSSCGAGSERNYTLNKQTYQLSFKTNEYGQELFCLTNDSGEACYRRKQK